MMTSTPTDKKYFVLPAKPFTESGLSTMAKGILATVEAHKSTGAEMGNIEAVLYQSGDNPIAVAIALAELERMGLLKLGDHKTKSWNPWQ